MHKINQTTLYNNNNSVTYCNNISKINQYIINWFKNWYKMKSFENDESN